MTVQLKMQWKKRQTTDFHTQMSKQACSLGGLPSGLQTHAQTVDLFF
jgi:hypothetical protein